MHFYREFVRQLSGSGLLDVNYFMLPVVTKVEPGADISYNHLRDSSFAAQESDTILMIRRLLNDQGEAGHEAELKIAFHRRTGIIGKRVKLMESGGYLWEMAKS